MSCVETQASQAVCLGCMADKNTSPLNKMDISILDYLLHPYNKEYIENLKSCKTVRMCAKCRLNIRNINTFRNIVLKNGFLLFQVSEFQEHKQSNSNHVDQPATVNQSNIDLNSTPSTTFLEIAVPDKKECSSRDPLLHEEVDIKHENDVKLEINNSQSSDDEERPDTNADDEECDGKRQAELKTGIKVEENNTEQCVKATDVNLKKLNEMVLNMQASKPITSYAYSKPPGFIVIRAPCSGTMTQNRYLNPSLPRHSVHQVNTMSTGSFPSTQGPRIVLTPQLLPMSTPANTASQPGTTVQLGNLLLTVQTVPTTIQQNTASNQASDKTKTGLEPTPEPLKKTEKKKVKYKRKNKVVYRDLPLKFECTECDKKYRAKDNLMRHVEHFHMGQTVECTVCNRTLKKNNLKWHMRRHEDAVYCQPCDKWYSPISYKVHVTSTTAHVAPEQYKYTCEDCGVKFHLKVTLTRHRNRMHLNAESKHKCPQCPKSFEYLRDVTRHVRSVHEKQERPRTHVCDICGVSMHSKTILSAHMVRHTGARPHKCNVCGATFGYKAALFTHNKLKHQQNKTNTNKNRKRGNKKPKKAKVEEKDGSKSEVEKKDKENGENSS